jgi:N6-L-threonylcarbamoyladenine synthase
MMNDLICLGVETSCDETAIAVVRLRAGGDVEVLAEQVASQTEEHALYGGVVPEIAARAHAERCDRLIALTISEAGVPWSALTGIAATAGPGLIGGVMVGLSAGKALALALDRPLVAVNHLEGHALSPRLSERIDFPYLLLLVSGGHCQFIVVEGLGRYRRLGATIDDAPGEAFDKTAKLLGLPGPGGPAVEREAVQGDPKAIEFPRPLLSRDRLDMSFSGLKTAVRRAAEAEPLTARRCADICASFQAAVADILTAKAEQALALVRMELPAAQCFVVAGGVAANQTLRERLSRAAEAAGFGFRAPPLKWCTDNGAMIALAGAERLRAGLMDPLDVPARPRWPLDETAALLKPALGAGRKGPKA